MTGGSSNMKKLLKFNLEKLFAVIDYLQAYQLWYTIIDYVIHNRYGQVTRLKKLYQAIYLTNENHPILKEVFDHTFITLGATWIEGELPARASPNKYSHLVRVLHLYLEPRIEYWEK